MDTVILKIRYSKAKNIILIICIVHVFFFIISISSFAEELSLNGFLQTNYSVRINDDNPEEAERKNLILGEERVQLKGSYYPSNLPVGVFVKGDVYHDWVEDKFVPEFREGYFDFTVDAFAIRAGRQIITWGVGDLLFINDIYPKDWEAFYSGRPLEYLKIGVDSVKLDIYSDIISVEVVTIPLFREDNLLSQGRFHIYGPYPDDIDEPGITLKNTEYAFRLYRYISNFDVSLYFYKGFFRIPGIKFNESDPNSFSYIYPKLAVYGISLQQNILGGIVGVEYGYYDSLEDRKGEDPGIENSKSKFLASYQRELAEDFTMGIQYYGELMHKYNQYEENLPGSLTKKKQLHQYITLRITKLFLYQTLKISLFTIYSPDEEDYFIISEINYKFTDNFQAMAGANIFGGSSVEAGLKPASTELGQHDKDDNIYITARYNF